jgi:pyridoxamine 5'-phosphate oxidase
MINDEANMDEGLTLLKDALAKENPDRPSIMTLATMSRNGSPRARSVVCRLIDDDGTIWFVSDARSKKNQQILAHKSIEAVFWLPSLKRQYRIRGQARIATIDDPHTKSLWRELPDATRAMFFWPTSGAPKSVDVDFPNQISSEVELPPTFQAIAIHPTLAEELDVTMHPHRRRRWRRKNQWLAEELNP